MAMLVNGVWQRLPYETNPKTGEFVRWDSQFRSRVSAEPDAEYRAETGRYRLYVSLACPWAHRTLIFRALKRLESVISVVVVEPVLDDGDWVFGTGPGCIPDPDNAFRFMRELYQAVDATYSGMVTVPVLWDCRRRTIVNNESSEIIRMLNGAFDAWGDASRDYYPPQLRTEIDSVNRRIYDTVNNGVYKAGFATTQSAYECALTALFGTLDWIEARLAHRRYLVGDCVTEADWRLFPTLVRFDLVYHTHFKCNLRRLTDYPNLWGYTRELYQMPGIAATVDFDHIKRHYFGSHPALNPSGIVPEGPLIDFAVPHGRG